MRGHKVSVLEQCYLQLNCWENTAVHFLVVGRKYNCEPVCQITIRTGDVHTNFDCANRMYV